MKSFLEHLIKQLVNNPDEVVIDELREESGNFLYTITVSPQDMGIVIGKDGNTINSIRNLAKAKAIKDNVRIGIQLNEVYDNN
ncbi:KH domain-containing protein [candidate division WWE3 bacterium]|jgi:predicted RNA-binding protein YlqC (UPF0109 family)|uniref:RNA-binding protein KhpA n=1 Tax=candidate division WWE3 bacterium TaxID=2053526 RepID=A0A3A4ZL15_UNCKA|nr:MAG: KH domain-containing protein [candidate division WWE3 bacterium]